MAVSKIRLPKSKQIKPIIAPIIPEKPTDVWTKTTPTSKKRKPIMKRFCNAFLPFLSAFNEYLSASRCLNVHFSVVEIEFWAETVEFELRNSCFLMMQKADASKDKKKRTKIERKRNFILKCFKDLKIS
jgi:hypothetical protein